MSIPSILLKLTQSIDVGVCAVVFEKQGPGMVSQAILPFFDRGHIWLSQRLEFNFKLGLIKYQGSNMSLLVKVVLHQQIPAYRRQQPS